MSESEETVDCPAPGCDYRNSKKRVKNHWGGKTDEAHTGNVNKAFEQASTESTQRKPTASSETSSEVGGSHPADDVPPREERDTGTSGCPECGSDDWYSSDAVLEAYGGQLSEENRKVVSQHDRVCTDCGEAYNE